MNVHRYDLNIPLAELVRETERAVAGWDWRRGAYGHALSLPAYGDLHPYGRYRYENFPCVDLLGCLPLFRQIFFDLRCDKVSFRLLRRAPSTSYAWHTDRWKGPGVVRFQIPIVSDASAFLVTTDYTDPDQLHAFAGGELSDASFSSFATAHAGHFCKLHLEPGRLHYFDTTRVHTLVNPGPRARITLSFDVVVNDWVREHFPAVREEVRDAAIAPPHSGRLLRAVAFARSRLYPLRNFVRSRLRERGTGHEI